MPNESIGGSSLCPGLVIEPLATPAAALAASSYSYSYAPRSFGGTQ